MIANLTAVEILQDEKVVGSQVKALRAQARQLAASAASRGLTASVKAVKVEGAPRDVILHVLEHGLDASTALVSITYDLVATYIPTEELDLVEGMWDFRIEEEGPEGEEPDDD